MRTGIHLPRAREVPARTVVLEPDEMGAHWEDVGRALRELRRRAGLTGDRLAFHSGISQSKISKIENARVTASPTDLERLLDALHADARERERVFTLARLANTEYESLRSELKRGLHHKQRELAAFEARTETLRCFLPAMLTGLLQTPDYARASLAAFPGDVADVTRRRIARQAILDHPGKRFSFLVTEQSVRWPLCGPAAMREQIARILALSTRPNVSLGVIPNGLPLISDGPMNTFTVYDERLATAELFSGTLLMRDPKDIAHHLSLFHFFAKHAAYGESAHRILTAVRNSFIPAQE
ncbi:helix-turn-helix domain-containing protein [Actinomadura flavalba]|uniref:helix-turn-helix domain-containing protein n=1 Tax=Actinomadura flavalba TaxID=1120938 RepID=UPI00036F3948|nr:helix-turn-helix transcriptional regulator [Actinomadura flavalba]